MVGLEVSVVIIAKEEGQCKRLYAGNIGFGRKPKNRVMSRSI